MTNTSNEATARPVTPAANPAAPAPAPAKSSTVAEAPARPAGNRQ